MVKRNEKVASRDDQLDLFDCTPSRERTNRFDTIGTDGRTPVAFVVMNGTNPSRLTGFRATLFFTSTTHVTTEGRFSPRPWLLPAAQTVRFSDAKSTEQLRRQLRFQLEQLA